MKIYYYKTDGGAKYLGKRIKHFMEKGREHPQSIAISFSELRKEKPKCSKFVGKKDDMFKTKRISKTLEKRAINIFGITTNPESAGYIATTGELINFPSPSGDSTKPDRGHFRVMRMGSKIPITSNLYINRTGDIRTQITPNQASFEIRQLPTQEQFDAMQKASEGKGKMFIDITDNNGRTIDSSEFSDFSIAKDWVWRNARD